MNSQLIPREYNGERIRFATTDDGQTVVRLSDLCQAIGVQNPSDVAKRLRPGQTITLDFVEGNRGNPNATYVTEPGMYRVLLRSNSPQAEPFQAWVEDDVLPSIRRTGSYSATPPLTELEVARNYVAALERNAQLETQTQAQAARIAADAPKVLFADAVATSPTTILVGELAKIIKGNGYDIGANRLFADLREDGYLIRREGSDWNMPTQKSMNLGLFVIKETAVTHSDGHVTVSKTPKVTGKGQAYFVNRYLNHKPAQGALPLAIGQEVAS